MRNIDIVTHTPICSKSCTAYCHIFQEVPKSLDQNIWQDYFKQHKGKLCAKF